MNAGGVVNVAVASREIQFFGMTEDTTEIIVTVKQPKTSWNLHKIRREQAEISQLDSPRGCAEVIAASLYFAVQKTQFSILKTFRDSCIN